MDTPRTTANHVQSVGCAEACHRRPADYRWMPCHAADESVDAFRHGRSVPRPATLDFVRVALAAPFVFRAGQIRSDRPATNKTRGRSKKPDSLSLISQSIPMGSAHFRGLDVRST